MKLIEVRKRVFSDITEDDKEKYHIITLSSIGVRIYFLREMSSGLAIKSGAVASVLWIAWVIFAYMLASLLNVSKESWSGAVFIGTSAVILFLYIATVIARCNGEV